MLKGLLKEMKKKKKREKNTVQRGEKVINKYLSIITNVNGLKSPIKIHRVAKWVRKHGPHICCLKETYLRAKDLYRLRAKGWKKYSKQVNREKEKAGLAIFTSDTINMKTKDHEKRQRRTLHTLKGIIHQEDITLVNIYAPNIGVP